MPTSEPTLSAHEREKIRVEEELRHEVRVAQRKPMWWVNTPFAIWLLTVIVGGVIPFAYSEIQKQFEIEKEERQLQQEAAKRLLSEIEFRVAQFNEVLNRARGASQEADRISDQELTGIIVDNKLSQNGLTLRALFSAALLLGVTSELGGIYAIPRTDENAVVWIGGSGWGNSHMPDGRGYRDKKYINDSLLSLWRKYATLNQLDSLSNSEISRVEMVFSNLRDSTKPNLVIESLSGISSNALTMREWSEKVNVSQIRGLREDTSLWIDGVETAWKQVTTLFPD